MASDVTSARGLRAKLARAGSAAFAALATLAALPGVVPAALAQDACLAARAEPGGIGGTGIHPGGIGGTGVPAATRDGGVGGTGSPSTSDASAGGAGGTGIVGTITGFASVCVNGLEVHYDARTPVTRNGAPAALDGLAVGQVVAIDAVAGPGGLQARSLAIVVAAAGPVTMVDVASGLFSVMGQTVRAGPDAAVVRASGERVPLGLLRVGELVEVSGLRNARGEIVASRVASVPTLREASLVGEVVVTGREGRSHGTRLEGDLRGSDRSGSDGRGRGGRGESLVIGRWERDRLRVERIEEAPGERVVARAERASVEGYVRRVDGRVAVGSLAVEGGGPGLEEGRRVRVTVQRDGERRVRVERVEAAGSRSGREGGEGGAGSSGRGEGSSGRGEGSRGSGGGSGGSGASDGGGSDRSGGDRGSTSGGGGDRGRIDRGGRDSRAR